MKLVYKYVFILLTLFALLPSQVEAQDYWVKAKESSVSQTKRKTQKLPSKYQIFKLNADAFKKMIEKSPLRGGINTKGIKVSFPMADGTLKAYSVFETPVFDSQLSARFPGIKSYAGQGIDDPSEVIRFSASHKGIKSMLFSSSEGYEFIEPYTNDYTHYLVYKRKDRHREDSNFECSLMAKAKKTNAERNNADDGVLRTFRLAVSTNGEYANYHGGSVTDALDAINTTMTRVNGIFEIDFNVTMTLINSTTDVIYTNANNDPYSASNGQWNSQLQSTLTNEIGEANYDVGHLFAQGGNNGNAGCIGCVCVNGQKGSGWTSRSTPEGDPFDVDYVAHELGHQFGGNHTWTHGGNEGTNVQMEPGSGSTIMGYAGITGNTDVQQNSDPYFHAASIEQITDYIKSTSCQTNTNTGNSVPVVDAGSNYTIPRGTPFTLSGTASDSDGDVLTYCWEQMDENNASTTYPSATATSGVAFRSYNPTISGERTFPALPTVLSGSTASTWEVIPNVGRTLNFRLSVRDNVAGGGTNESDNMVVTVNGNTGPFVLNSPNTNVSWSAGSSQTISWDVAGTNGSPVNASNVNILLSTDGGNSFNITLAANTANDGSHVVVVPNNQGTNNRIKVEAANNIFFDVSNTSFTITGSVPCTATTPTGLNSSSVGSNTVTLSWNAVTGASGYDLRYRTSGSSSWITNSVAGVSSTLSGLSAETSYEAQVRSNCADGSNSTYSSSEIFTTTEVQLDYCASNGQVITDEYISNVTITNINNTSGVDAGGYTDFTALIADITVGETTSISISPTWTGTVYSEGYSVWIDYNSDGDFTDGGEQVFSQAASTATLINGSFIVPASALLGPTRMRVSMKYNGVPDPCESFTYGEVEDYTVNISTTSCTAGSSCDDGDACTTGDVYDSDCNCAGTFTDADGDGVCDADDICAGGDDNQDGDNDGTPDFCDSCNNNLDGTSCDDGDACTTGDVYDANCNCVGTFADADGDGVCDTDDICAGGDDNQDEDGDGTPDFCDSCNNNLDGTSCDDGDACTTGDVYDANCNCAGTYTDTDNDGVCDADDICAGGDDNQDGDNDGTPDFCDDCDNNLEGTACDDGNACTSGDIYDSNCNCAGTLADADGDGVCDTDDICAGGDDNQDEDGDGTPDFCDPCNNNLDGTSCDDGDACTTGDVYDANCNCAGTYTDTDNDGVCDADDICAGGDDNQDGDNDGTPDFCDDCDNNLAGTACDDGNACTTNDVYDANCNCAGLYTDADNDGVCDADDLCPNSAAGVAVNGNGCVVGCTDNSATNYNANAQVDDGSCVSCNDGIQNGDETGVDCGGSCDACDDGCAANEISFTILTDNYPGETTWTITNSNGATVASGGPYSSQGTTYVETACIVDDCYTFQINDSYGDGICCGYGNGSYTLSGPDGSVIVSGGNFNSSESTAFCLPEGDGGSNCLEIDFNNYNVIGYGNNQDQGTSSDVENGAGRALFNNAWKSISQNYTVTSQTVVELEFSSTTQGEIHGFGFDNNSSISSGFTFQLYGTQNWGNRDFDYTTPGIWQSFTIPVGQYYTGSFDRIFLVADHDANPKNGNAYFRNIKIYEGSSCNGSFDGEELIISARDEKTEMVDGLPDGIDKATVTVYPNPTRDIIYLNVGMDKKLSTSVQILNSIGQLVLDQNIDLVKGDNTVALSTQDLKSGTYFVKVNIDGNNVLEKITVLK